MNDELVKTLREKTEETDLATILKPTLGGFSRKSVREYISMMRQLQYEMQQSFAEEAQRAQTERERLLRELAEVSERAASAEDALSTVKPLTEKAAALEKDMDEAIERIQADAGLLEQLRQELNEQQEELLQTRQERDALRVQAEQQELEICALRTALEEHGEAPREMPVKDAKESDGEDETAAPTSQEEALQLQLAILTREQETASQQLESVIRQEKLLFQALNECQAELETRRDQNLCLEAENEALAQQLSDQMCQNVALNREITYIRTANETLTRKLETLRKDNSCCDARTEI